MKATLDGQSLFDGEELKIYEGSWQRGSLEKSVAGLNGVLSVDLGLRSRKIRQVGSLLAGSDTALREKIGSIGGYIDGRTHTLKTEMEQQFDNLRMDRFEVKGKRFSGNGVCCDYEITYTQLRG